MTSTTTRRQATAARKEQIVGAAVALLAERGYHATTLDAICQQAGLSSKRLITYHFSSKDELFAAIAKQVVADAETFMRPTLDAAAGARDTLTAVIRTTVAFMATHPDEMRALQQIIINGGHAWDRHHAESITRLAGLFAEGQRTGAFRAGNPQLLASVLRAALDSMHPLLAAGLDPDRCADELVDLFDRATRSSPSDPYVAAASS
ncbi:MAG TPA: TetR family transcriptional regulator [Baekduia sp.]|nr:TetR family transcriptional regulator [Baekduia sp.]